MAGYGQNLEQQGLIAKIFRNKDLASEFDPFTALTVEKLLGEPARIGRGCSFSRFSVKVVGHRESNSFCGRLWKRSATEKGKWVSTPH